MCMRQFFFPLNLPEQTATSVPKHTRLKLVLLSISRDQLPQYLTEIHVSFPTVHLININHKHEFSILCTRTTNSQCSGSTFQI